VLLCSGQDLFRTVWFPCHVLGTQLRRCGGMGDACVQLAKTDYMLASSNCVPIIILDVDMLNKNFALIGSL